MQPSLHRSATSGVNTRNGICGIHSPRGEAQAPSDATWVRHTRIQPHAPDVTRARTSEEADVLELQVRRVLGNSEPSGLNPVGIERLIGGAGVLQDALAHAAAVGVELLVRALGPVVEEELGGRVVQQEGRVVGLLVAGGVLLLAELQAGLRGDDGEEVDGRGGAEGHEAEGAVGGGGGRVGVWD